MTTRDYDFNEKTGELQRQKILVPLGRLHADIFGALDVAQGPMTVAEIARAINMPVHAVENEMPALRARLKPLGILIASSRPHRGVGGGKWLQFEDVKKWEPTIPPPVILEGERP